MTKTHSTKRKPGRPRKDQSRFSSIVTDPLEASANRIVKAVLRHIRLMTREPRFLKDPSSFPTTEQILQETLTKVEAKLATGRKTRVTRDTILVPLDLLQEMPQEALLKAASALEDKGRLADANHFRKRLRTARVHQRAISQGMRPRNTLYLVPPDLCLEVFPELRTRYADPYALIPTKKKRCKSRLQDSVHPSGSSPDTSPEDQPTPLTPSGKPLDPTIPKSWQTYDPAKVKWETH